MTNKKIVIIDGNSLINRAYFAIQRPMITQDGFYTQGIYGFLSMLTKIRKDYSPTHMLVAFDRKAPTFRHLEYSEYKAGRKKMPIELAMEMPVLKEVLAAMGIRCFEIDGYEADDIIGTTAKMAEAANIPALIVTGDKDALQLATVKTSVIITKKGISEFKLYDDAAMIEEYGFDHIQFIDYKALRGDTSDNIPGIPGVGEKTAIKLIQQFGSLENLLSNVDQVESASLKAKIADNAMSAMMSKRLATIVTTVPVDYTIEDCAIKGDDVSKLIDLYTRLEFKKSLAALLKDAKTPEIATENKTVSISAKTLTTRALLDIFKEPQLIVDINCDDNHVGVPYISSLQFSVPGSSDYQVIENPELTELKLAVESSSSRLIGFHLGRVYYAFLANGIDISGLNSEFDCALAQYVLAPSTKAPSLAELLLEKYKINIQSESTDAQIGLFANANTENCGLKLAAIEALAKDQKVEIKEAGLDTVLYDIELPLSKVLADMESCGIKVDRNELVSFGDGLKIQIDALQQEIFDLAGEEFNVNSPMQLGNILFEKLMLPAGKKTAKGYSTSADILEKLAPDYPIVSKVLEFRMLSKLRSTYVEGLLPLISENGKIHPHFQQTVTATGRISCTEPNLQNIPVRTKLGRELRKSFVTDSSEYLFIGADYSQIELRIMAHMSKDPTLIKCFNDGLDIHRETASKVFNVPFDEVTSEMRSNAKAVNFGVIYGMSGFGLASELTISRKQAEKYISDYFDRFKDVKAFLDSQVSECRQNGCVRTLYGRRRVINEINASQFMTRQLGERLAMNTPIQGTAADIIKIAMNNVYEALKQCPRSKLILQIHDELIIQAHKSEAEAVNKLLTESMENAAELAVKLDISLGEGENWYMLK